MKEAGYDKWMQEESINVFAAAARSHCALIDVIDQHDSESIFSALERELTALQSGIISVEMGSGADQRIEKPRIGHDAWKALGSRIDAVIGPACWALADSLIRLGGKNKETEDASRARHAWDDFADIYRDLKEGVEMWDLGDAESRAEAQWHWRFGYEHHWGWHLMRAALTVHEVKYYLRSG